MPAKTLATLTATLLLCASALAQTAAGGFTGPATVVTAEHTKSLADDTPVTLRGQIERHLGGENYLFRDATGTIEVEIDARHWSGQSVSPQDKVEISGEVDKHWTSIEIDVQRLRKL
ncbi:MULTISPECIES: NirD/YgiW/YdeI family stress tolerance protein [Giesbergeria]|uniref:NirD/YgiW/YdeI family stress tolerance protein n=1 Tax=Giesbergeria sinuosa TaxID=80883 RepID=A0ABV9QGA9_9BURK